MPTEIVTCDELAAELGVSKQTLDLWRHQGTGPTGFRAGKHLRYRRSDVEAWIDDQLAKESA